MNNILENAVVIDVRTPQEFNEGHYEGAINIPVDKIGDKIDELKKMNKRVVAYCRSGARSGLAVSILRQSGIQEVVNAGGINDILQLANGKRA